MRPLKFEENPYHHIQPFEQIDQIEKDLTIERYYLSPEKKAKREDINAISEEKFPNNPEGVQKAITELEKNLLRPVVENLFKEKKSPKKVKNASKGCKKAKKTAKKVSS